MKKDNYKTLHELTSWLVIFGNIACMLFGQVEILIGFWFGWILSIINAHFQKGASPNKA